MFIDPYRCAARERVYAIGDVHGCESLFVNLLALVRQDNATRTPAVCRIILLGDVIDRGPDSSRLLRRLSRYTQASDRFTVLMGNHEHLMSAALSGDMIALASWIGLGGDQTLLSFGVSEPLIREGATARLLADARRSIEPELVIWLDRLPMTARSGDLVFVHAGVRPGIPIDQQAPEDLLSIRTPFLMSDEARGYLIVHGHTIHVGGPDQHSNRIGIDTGAYQTGRLTSIGFDADDCWTLST